VEKKTRYVLSAYRRTDARTGLLLVPAVVTSSSRRRAAPFRVMAHTEEATGASGLLVAPRANEFDLGPSD